MSSGRFVPKAELKAVGTATLQERRRGRRCTSSSVWRTALPARHRFDRLFKPYMQFEKGADGKIFRNWDLAENYRIAARIPQFDRSGDVLGP